MDRGTLTGVVTFPPWNRLGTKDYYSRGPSGAVDSRDHSRYEGLRQYRLYHVEPADSRTTSR